MLANKLIGSTGSSGSYAIIQPHVTLSTVAGNVELAVDDDLVAVSIRG